MCGCVCVCVCPCRNVCLFVFGTCVCSCAHVCVKRLSNKWVCECVCVSVSLQERVSVCVCVCVCAHVFAHVWVCVCVCVSSSGPWTSTCQANQNMSTWCTLKVSLKCPGCKYDTYTQQTQTHTHTHRQNRTITCLYYQVRLTFHLSSSSDDSACKTLLISRWLPSSWHSKLGSETDVH